MDIKISPSYIKHIKSQMPAHLAFDDFIAACKQPLRRSIRVNTLKITIDSFLSHARSFGWHLEPIPWCESGFWISTSDEHATLKLGNHPFHQMGLFYIQEASSMLPPSALMNHLPTKNLTVLDMAAAPGSKTTQLASLVNNEGIIVANEIASSRLKGLYSNIQRCGVTNTCLTHYDGRAFDSIADEVFDAILLDAPCGGEGTVRKDPNALSEWNIHHVNQLASLQFELLQTAANILKPEGELVYSTCTLSHEENQHVCEKLLAVYGNAVTIEPLDSLFAQASQSATPEGYLHVWPQIYDSEGFFVAKIKKKDSTKQASSSPNSKLGKFPFQPLSTKEFNSIAHYLIKEFGIDASSFSHRLWQRDNVTWLFPEGITSLIGKIKFDRMGTKILEHHKKGPKLLHEFVVAFGHLAKTRRIELTAEEADQFMLGQDVHRDTFEWKQGYVIATFLQQPLGLAKVIRNKLKNNLSRDVILSSGSPQFSSTFD